MYQVGEQVVYGIHGVCRVVEIEERVIDRKRMSYLVLEPEGQTGSRYLVPTHNEAAMAKLRPMLTAQEMESLIHADEVRQGTWIADENRRKQTYRELIGSGDRAALMTMVHTLYVHKAAQSAAGKKFHQCDDNFLRDAEKLLSSEIAMVMGLEQDSARTYLRQQLKAE